MEKIVFSDGTEQEICNGAAENCVTVQYNEESEIEQIASNFTIENLSRFKILNSSGVECTTICNKKLVSYTVNAEEKTIVFNLCTVSQLEERLLKLEASQSDQDDAITELAEIVAEV